MADLPSSGAGDNESEAVETVGEAGHVVVQIDEKAHVEEVEQTEEAVHVKEEVKEEQVREEVKEEVTEEVKEDSVAVTEGESERGDGEGVMGEEGDRDSLVPGTGSINGDLDEEEEEEESDEDGDEENMGNVVQGTTETILNKLEENLSQAPPIAEGDLLQVGFACWIASIFL